jgi:hypothetical protein
MTAHDTTTPSAAAAAPAAAASPSARLQGRWRNGLGSEMDLQVVGDRLTGRYRTGVGSPRPEMGYELAGFAVGDALAFCVDFRPHGSVASWTGHHTDDGDGERLVTLWHLAAPVERPQGAPDLWRGTLSGADEFRRIG